MNRYDFVYLFDAEFCNPNGDPLSDNKPRMDPETGHGIVTDVAIKRRIRDHIIKWKNQEPPYGIHLVPGTNRNDDMYTIAGIDPKEKDKKTKKNQDGVKLMLEKFWDIRTFGAVLSTGPNFGQVTGPVQIGFSRTVDPIYVYDIQMAVCTSAGENKDKSGNDKENRTLGMKYVTPYGLYVCKGTVSGNGKTGFSQEDLDVLWESIMGMWDSNRTHSKMGMNSRDLFIFRHDGISDPVMEIEKRETEGRMGVCPSYVLWDSIVIKKGNENRPPRQYSDYEITIKETPLGVSLIHRH